MLAVPAVIVFYVLAAILAGRGLLQPRDYNIRRNVPLTQVFSGTENITDFVGQSVRALSKHWSGRRATVPSIDKGGQGWWYGSFNVGRSHDLKLMVDTGSTDVAINPNLYRSSKRGHTTGTAGVLTYDGTQPDGCGTADIMFNAYEDHVFTDGLFVPRQPFANLASQLVNPGNGTVSQYPGDGVIGWSSASSHLNTSSWFEKICAQHAVPECRFGIALNTDATGQLHLGGIDSTMFHGDLNVANVRSLWALNGDVGVNGMAVDSNVTILLDTGTVNIIGPIAAVRKIFDATGIHSNLTTVTGCSQVLLGYYDCANPPQIGFSFPYDSADDDAKNFFDIEAKAFAAADNGNGTCTTTLIGIDFPPSADEFWILGQSWFQGKYVDHNLSDQTLGFANLVPSG